MLIKGSVLQIYENEAVLGFEDGTLFHCPLGNFNYYPRIGDSVTIYGDLEGEHVVTKSGPSVMDMRMFDHRDPGRNEVSRQYTPQRVNKAAYVLAAFLGGWLGVHKFMTGRMAQGFVYILLSFFFGVSFILSLIEAAVALGQAPDEYGMIYPKSLFNF